MNINLNRKSPQLQAMFNNIDKRCTNCGQKLHRINHIEYDGTEYGSKEPFWECPDQCTEEEIIL